MALRKKKDLLNVFIRDHQQMTSLLYEVISYLENGDIVAAKKAAKELNSLAGPHVEFEQQTLYPALQMEFGESIEHRLLIEHENARAGLGHLLTAESEKLLKPGFQRQVVAALRSGLRHAENCNNLVSHLEHLSEDQQLTALAKLKKLKKKGKHWTELTG